MVLQLRKDQLLGIHRSKSEVPPELLPPFTVGWGEGVDDRYMSWDVVTIQITNESDLCVQEAEEFTPGVQIHCFFYRRRLSMLLVATL